MRIARRYAGHVRRRVAEDGLRRGDDAARGGGLLARQRRLGIAEGEHGLALLPAPGRREREARPGQPRPRPAAARGPRTARRRPPRAGRVSTRNSVPPLTTCAAVTTSPASASSTQPMPRVPPRCRRTPRPGASPGRPSRRRRRRCSSSLGPANTPVSRSTASVATAAAATASGDVGRSAARAACGARRAGRPSTSRLHRGRAASGRTASATGAPVTGRLLGQHRDLDVADPDQLPAVQRRLAGALAVDQRAVGGVEVGQLEPLRFEHRARRAGATRARRGPRGPRPARARARTARPGGTSTIRPASSPVRTSSHTRPAPPSRRPLRRPAACAA